MRIERALRVRDELKNRVDSIYSIARLGGETSEYINQAMSEARKAMPAKTPQWVYSFIDGYRAALQAELYRDWLVYGGYVDGVFYSTYRKRDDYYGKHGIEPSAYADNGLVSSRGHYWSDRVQYHGGIFSREAVKPYFIG